MIFRAKKASLAFGLFVTFLSPSFASDTHVDLCAFAIGVFGDRDVFQRYIPRFAAGRAKMTPASMHRIQDAQGQSFADRRDVLAFFGFRFSEDLESWVPGESNFKTKRNLTADDLDHLIDHGVIKVKDSGYDDAEMRFVAEDSDWRKPVIRRDPPPRVDDRFQLTPGGRQYFGIGLPKEKSGSSPDSK